MTDHVTIGNWRVAKVLHDFVTTEALPGTGIDPDSFWAGADDLLTDLTPPNRALLARRDELQSQIDSWHRCRAIETHNPHDYKAFLTDIGYLLPEPAGFAITTADVDPEIASTPGPQLVVPILNARFALNAANARWGSLYDALYGTDVIPETGGAERGSAYNQARGHVVIAYARKFLDSCVRLQSGSWTEVTQISAGDRFLAVLGEGPAVGLADPAQFAGYTGNAESPTSVLLVNHGLHIEMSNDQNLWMVLGEAA